jgi:hypothetical protein
LARRGIWKVIDDTRSILGLLSMSLFIKAPGKRWFAL